MSTSDAISIIQQWYETVDIDRFVAADVRWEIARGFPEEGLYTDRQQIKEMLARLLARFDEWSLRIDGMSGTGSEVIAYGAYVGRTKQGRDFEVDFCHVWRVANGQIQSNRHIANTVEMQAALS